MVNLKGLLYYADINGIYGGPYVSRQIKFKTYIGALATIAAGTTCFIYILYLLNDVLSHK